MAEVYYYLIAGVILLAVVPLVPKFVRLRIRALRFVHWYCLADWHERHFKVLVPVVRIIMAVIAAVLFGLAYNALK